MNPWWVGKEDYHVKLWKEQKLHWRLKWLEKLSLKPFSLNFVLGPRQVGKTTRIKLLIQELLKDNPPEAVLYINVEVLPSHHELLNLLREFQGLKEKDFRSTSR